MYVMWEHEPDMIKAAHGIDGDDEVSSPRHDRRCTCLLLQLYVRAER